MSQKKGCFYRGGEVLGFLVALVVGSMVGIAAALMMAVFIQNLWRMLCS